MARTVVTQYLSDLSGIEADESVELTIDGKAYRLDLTTDEARELRGTIASYTDKGERLSTEEAIKSLKPGNNTRARKERARIREWARENGYDIGDRGRISQTVYDAYYAANT